MCYYTPNNIKCIKNIISFKYKTESNIEELVQVNSTKHPTSIAHQSRK